MLNCNIDPRRRESDYPNNEPDKISHLGLRGLRVRCPNSIGRAIPTSIEGWLVSQGQV